MKGIKLFLLLVCILPCSTYGDEGGAMHFKNRGEERLSLNGWWKFSAAAGLADTDDWTHRDFISGAWDRLRVPGNWDTENAYADYVGTGYYRKEFFLPEDWEGSIVRLCFDAVYQTAEVWLNGVYLGKHVGGYTPFEFDVTDYIRLGKSNVIALTANNEYQRGAWWHWGGISRDVNLFRNNEQRIVWQQVSTEPDIESGSASVSIAVKLRNHSDRGFNGRLHASVENLQDGATIDIPGEHAVVVEANSETVVSLKIQLEADDVQLWDLNNPNLYRVHTTLEADDGSTVHRVADRFGIRKIEVREARVLLNGRVLRLNGFNRVSDHWAYGQTEPDHVVKFDIDAMKAMGGNFTRIMHYPQADNLLDYCDEVGMLLIEEIPVWGKGDPQLQPGNPLTKQWLSEMVVRDYNHPSIIGWSVANEIADGDLDGRKMSSRVYGYVATMLEHVESLDPTRLKTYASFTAGSAGNTGVDPADLCDLICINSYGEASRVAERCHEVWPEKPIFVTEIGKSPLGEDLSQSGLAESLKRAIKNLGNLDYVVGCALWTYNDYRSSFGGTPIGQCRTWGVYNAWRQPKKGAAEIRQLFDSSDQDVPFKSMYPVPDSLSDTAPTIWAVVPLENSCMVGFSVLDENDHYEIEYTRDNSAPQTVQIKGLRGAAKVYGLEPDDYSFRIRRLSNGVSGEWSFPYEVTLSPSGLVHEREFHVNLTGRPPDISVVEPFFKMPAITEGTPAAGKLVRQMIPEYEGTDVHHLLYLPESWDPQKKYPMIIEYNGNGACVDETSGFGYGISGGKDYIWAVLPFVNENKTTEAETWWGKKEYTVEYAKKTVPMICQEWGGDADRVVLTGVSRGAISCNYIGLHDDEIAGLWAAMIPSSHYDGRTDWYWGMSEEDAYRAAQRVQRLGDTPQLILGEYHLRANHTDANDLKAVREGGYTDMQTAIQELDLVPLSVQEGVRDFIATHYPQGDITFVDLPFVNHTSAWVFTDIPEREMVRSWLREVLK